MDLPPVPVLLARCFLTKKKLTVAAGEVAALDHEILDDAVECAALVSVALLASDQRTWVVSVDARQLVGKPEVLGRLGHGVSIQAHDDPTQSFVAMLNVEIDLPLSTAPPRRTTVPCG
jgi:hypothetical protein